MKNNFNKGMRIIEEKGNPTFFITFTCNPQHLDIINNLFPGQKSADRPDIVTRFFYQMVSEFHRDLKKNKMGKYKAHMTVKEDQKRGNPHIHCVLITDPIKVNEVDNYISAEIPNKKKYPRLHELVTNMMVHSPCDGQVGTSTSCHVKGKCKYGFPKPFCNE
jgi:hypothetical protein